MALIIKTHQCRGGRPMEDRRGKRGCLYSGMLMNGDRGRTEMEGFTNKKEVRATHGAGDNRKVRPSLCVR